MLAGHGLSALAYNRETIVRAACERRDLVQEVTSCCFHVVCVDPEHLISASWYKILDSREFQHNLIFVAVEEVHLIREWVIFRRAYAYIGQFLRGHLPLDVSVFGLSATLKPGNPTSEVYPFLGFHDFTMFRYSNERLDIQFIFEPLQHAITSRSYPQLLPYLNARRKVIVYVPSMEISTRLYIYLIGLDTSGYPGRRFRQYDALCDPEFNSETLRLMETDSHLQVIIATMALANGVHSSKIDDSLSLGMPKTLSQTEQQAGRASRSLEAMRRAVVFMQKSDITNVKKFMACMWLVSSCFHWFPLVSRAKYSS
ncbi:P-loop containing nucleoside triphosphate hydrolase protein [Mycena venus]|uniref:DNA 3'-5' helicase n=1 Tax=Mycena venus TaxID=2733690 RepID=A0A8H6XSQ0_9AGAR|nr:P-loop containing nucleoside triphosphate hydrolase protein [Mycena venus]